MRTPRTAARFAWGAGVISPVVLISLLLLGSTAAQAQEQRFRERQVLDPNTNEWIDQAPTTQEAPSNPVDQARLDLAEQRPGRARVALQKWQKGRGDDERYYESMFLLGEAYFEQKDFWKAYQQYLIVADNTSGELFDAANRRCVDVARAFLSGQKRIVWYILRLPAYAEGVDILDRVWERVPGTRLGELALKLKADYHYGNGDVDLAGDDYNSLVQQYQSGRYKQLAMLRSAQSAEAAFPGVRFDDQSLVDAEERYRQVRGAYPTFAEHEKVAERLEGIRQQRAEKDLYIAHWYERVKRPEAAQFYYKVIVKEYPDTLEAADARTRLRAMGVNLDETGAGEGGAGPTPPPQPATKAATEGRE